MRVTRDCRQELVATILSALSVEFKLYYLRGDRLFLVKSGCFIPLTFGVPGEGLNEYHSFHLIISRCLLESSVQPLELVVPKVSEPDHNRKGLILPSCFRVNGIFERSHVKEDVEDMSDTKALLDAPFI